MLVLTKEIHIILPAVLEYSTVKTRVSYTWGHTLLYVSQFVKCFPSLRVILQLQLPFPAFFQNILNGSSEITRLGLLQTETHHPLAKTLLVCDSVRSGKANELQDLGPWCDVKEEIKKTPQHESLATAKWGILSPLRQQCFEARWGFSHATEHNNQYSHKATCIFASSLPFQIIPV